MEETIIESCCVSCLDKNALKFYHLRNGSLRSIFQTDNICLCIACKSVAQRAELFIEHVQKNQIVLENSYKFQDDSTLQAVRKQSQLFKLTTISPLNIVQISGDDSGNEDTFTIVDNYNESNEEVKVKLEMDLKEEDNDILDHLEAEFVDDDEFQESCVKEENDFQLKALLKQEVGIEHDDIDLSCLRKTLKKCKIKKKGVKKKEFTEKVDNNDTQMSITIYITRDECMKERADKLKSEKYLNSTYKCQDCAKGFMFRDSYQKHLERHRETNGDYVCDVCKQRFCSEEKLQSHKRYHQIRYKCTSCDLTRVSRHSFEQHHAAAHRLAYSQYNCDRCPKVFTRKISLRKHIHYAHRDTPRVACAHCRRTYANKDVLKSHMILKHPKQVGALEESRRHVCAECGKAFKSPSHLRKHSIKHSLARDYYCVECDKSFKSDSILKHHLKTASPHVNYLELPLPCEHCDKRFAIRRDLERHTNRVHLNIKPFQCPQCDKAYVNGWSLTEHKRIVHEGYKRPLRYPCTFCDKVFDRNQILKGHLRTHTGERPYECTKCPAKFSQASILGTHIKLIHLKLTRDGKPKGVNGK